MKTKKVIAAAMVILMVFGSAFASRSIVDISTINQRIDMLNENGSKLYYDYDNDVVVWNTHLGCKMSTCITVYGSLNRFDVFGESYDSIITLFEGADKFINVNSLEKRVDTIFTYSTDDGYPLIYVINGKDVSGLLGLN